MSEVVIAVLVLIGVSDANFATLIQGAVALLTSTITGVVGYLIAKLSQERRREKDRDRP